MTVDGRNPCLLRHTAGRPKHVIAVDTVAELAEPQACGGEGVNVGGEEPGGCPGVASQSQVGEANCPFLRAV